MSCFSHIHNRKMSFKSLRDLVFTKFSFFFYLSSIYILNLTAFNLVLLRQLLLAIHPNKFSFPVQACEYDNKLVNVCQT